MRDTREDFLCLLGLSMRAGRTEIGEDGVGDAIAAGKARVIFLASDAAENSTRRIYNLTRDTHAIVVNIPFTKAELGGAFGRGSCAMAAVTESGFALSAASKLALISPGTYDDTVQALRSLDERIRSRRGTNKKRSRK